MEVAGLDLSLGLAWVLEADGLDCNVYWLRGWLDLRNGVKEMMLAIQSTETASVQHGYASTARCVLTALVSWLSTFESHSSNRRFHCCFA